MRGAGAGGGEETQPASIAIEKVIAPRRARHALRQILIPDPWPGMRITARDPFVETAAAA